MVEGIKPREVHISAVHDVESAGLGDQDVQDVDVVQFPLGNMDKFGNAATQVQQRVELDGALSFAKSRPRKQGKTQVDSRGIEGINRCIQLDAELFVCIELLGR